jgi:ribosomal protein S18 acetylase RimI-like enzyme
MNVFQAHSEHLEEVSKLFDQYRVFYKSSSDYEAAKQFLKERFEKRDSTIFVAGNDERIVGFTQLYPSFSSVSMKRIWILNDLFVDEDYRRNGVAQLLMGAAESFARETGAVRIILATQVSNVVAQSLYELRGYAKDEEFYHYALRLG